MRKGEPNEAQPSECLDGKAPAEFSPNGLGE